MIQILVIFLLSDHERERDRGGSELGQGRGDDGGDHVHAWHDHAYDCVYACVCDSQIYLLHDDEISLLWQYLLHL